MASEFLLHTWNNQLLPELNIIFLFVIGGVALLLFLNSTSSGPDLSAIPAFGPRGRFTSYIGSYFFLRDTSGILQMEIDKRQPGEMFRVPFLDHWEVVVTGKKYINELAQAHDDDLSVIDAVADVLQTEFTMGPSIKYDQYHVGVIGSTMTRNLVARFDDVYDEIACAFEDVISERGKGESTEWVSIPAFDAVINVVARTGNRLFVGLPLCRHPEYLRLARNWAIDVFIGAFFINFMPWVLKQHPGKTELKRIVTERVHLDKEFGIEREDRPALTNILYHLAANPERYLEPLRNEVEAVVGRQGWTKAALRDMVKIDSFVRESERFNGLSSLIMTRKVVNPKGFTFSNGVHLPMDSIVSVANYATHHDDAYYTDANTFDGFRFSSIREAAEGFDAIRHQMVHTTPEYVTFGHGRHSCPGRFFAANELKLALAYVVLYYDIKLGDDCNGIKPENSWMSIALIPDKRAHLLFRRRKDVDINL
ncbi:hypothetical protein H0H92_004233 [Tricholoma furcatifolium]|nr:hypothetical protein H0H92_004233 [Tricholoma furcatifolium]